MINNLFYTLILQTLTIILCANNRVGSHWLIYLYIFIIYLYLEPCFSYKDL